MDGQRRYRERLESEWKIREEPALAIIDPATRAKVQQRNSDNARGAGRPGRAGYSDHAFSGLLRCGACGSPLSIVSRPVKNGRHFSQYGCSARNAKGASVCSNGLTVGEARLIDAVLAALREYFASSGYEGGCARRTGRMSALASSPPDAMTNWRGSTLPVRNAEARVEKITEALARIGYSEPLVVKLRVEEAKLLDARKVLADAAVPATPSPPPPAYSSRAMLAVVENIGSAATAKPQKAKELRGVVESILMTPKPDGYGVRISETHQPRHPEGRRG